MILLFSSESPGSTGQRFGVIRNLWSPVCSVCFSATLPLPCSPSDPGCLLDPLCLCSQNPPFIGISPHLGIFPNLSPHIWGSLYVPLGLLPLGIPQGSSEAHWSEERDRASFPLPSSGDCNPRVGRAAARSLLIQGTGARSMPRCPPPSRPPFSRPSPPPHSWKRQI